MTKANSCFAWQVLFNVKQQHLEMFGGTGVVMSILYVGISHHSNSSIHDNNYSILGSIRSTPDTGVDIGTTQTETHSNALQSLSMNDESVCCINREIPWQRINRGHNSVTLEAQLCVCREHTLRTSTQTAGSDLFMGSASGELWSYSNWFESFALILLDLHNLWEEVLHQFLQRITQITLKNNVERGDCSSCVENDKLSILSSYFKRQQRKSVQNKACSYNYKQRLAAGRGNLLSELLP